MKARPGTISVFEGMREIADHPNVTFAFKRYDVGETIPETGDVRQRICEVALVIKQSESVREHVEWVQSKLKVLDSDGNDLLTSLVPLDDVEYEIKKGTK